MQHRKRGGGEGGKAHAASKTTLLHLNFKRLKKSSLRFSFSCVTFVSKGNFYILILQDKIYLMTVFVPLLYQLLDE